MKSTEPVLNPSYGEEWIERYGWYLQAAGRSKSTQRIYRAALRRFAVFVPELLEPSRHLIYAWMRARRSTVGLTTWNQELCAVRAFYRWAYVMGCAAEDFSQLLPAGIKPPKRLPRYLTDDQVGLILGQPDLGTFVGFRDHVILRLAYETGITASEIAALELGDVLVELSISVAAGSGRRVLPISRELTALLDDWVQLRRTAKPGKSTALFVTNRGKPFRSGRTIWDIVDRYARRALGLGRAFDRVRACARRKPWSGQYPHLLRASF
ncbi:MAG TPA: tyrosine-type recombinase/integrase, partial [Gammaproteobacteria bacterium]